jgi:protease-4
MTEPESTPSPTPTQAQKVIDKLVFAALREQTRARRWRIFFMLFFIGYISVVTTMFFSQGDGGYAAGGKPDGEMHTALVRLEGVIASDEAAGADNIIRGLKAAFEHEDTAGIVLEINSPGGSPVQSAYIFDEVRRLREEHADIPLYAVVTDIAASGGYFVASSADEIYVNKSSLVGSIGVRMDAFGFVEMMKNLGIERRLIVAGENKGLFDPFLPEQSEQRAHLQAMLDQVHQHFIAAVRTGRGDRLQENPDIFSGLVWSGEEAMKLGLVDDYGTTRSVARQLEAEDIVDFTPKTELLDRIADRLGASVGRGISQQLLGRFSLQ